MASIISSVLWCDIPFPHDFNTCYKDLQSSTSTENFRVSFKDENGLSLLLIIWCNNDNSFNIPW